MISDTFDLSVDAVQLVDYIKAYGRRKEAAGGIEWPDWSDGPDWNDSGFRLCRMAAVPEVTQDAGAVVLTWFYGPSENFRRVASCVVWQITGVANGVRVEASCTVEDLRRAFYQMIEITSRDTGLLPVKEPLSGGQEAESDELLVKSTRGPNAGTYERVREAHRLIKEGNGKTWSIHKARTYSDTYHKWCKDATGEDPL